MRHSKYAESCMNRHWWSDILMRIGDHYFAAFWMSFVQPNKDRVKRQISQASHAWNLIRYWNGKKLWKTLSWSDLMVLRHLIEALTSGREFQWLHLLTQCGNITMLWGLFWSRCCVLSLSQAWLHGDFMAQVSGTTSGPGLSNIDIKKLIWIWSTPLILWEIFFLESWCLAINSQRRMSYSVLSFVRSAQMLVNEWTKKRPSPFFCNRQSRDCWYLVVSITWQSDVWYLFIALPQSRA